MKKERTAPLFIASSFSDFLGTLFYRLALLAALIYCCYHFNENENVVGIVCIVLFIFFMLAGETQVLIYKDRVLEKSDSLVGLLFRWKHREIAIADIKKAYVPIQEEISAEEKRNRLILALVFRARFSKPGPVPVLFELKNGEICYSWSTAGSAHKETIVELVNKLVREHDQRRLQEARRAAIK